MKPAILFLLLFASPVTAQICGDCNRNGRVTVDEIVTAVNNLLNDACDTIGCTDATCGDNCAEFPGATVNGLNYQCGITLCTNTNVTACVTRLVTQQTGLCHRVP